MKKEWAAIEGTTKPSDKKIKNCFTTSGSRVGKLLGLEVVTIYLLSVLLFYSTQLKQFSRVWY